jgi:hypothetical protein
VDPDLAPKGRSHDMGGPGRFFTQPGRRHQNVSTPEREGRLLTDSLQEDRAFPQSMAKTCVLMPHQLNGPEPPMELSLIHINAK